MANVSQVRQAADHLSEVLAFHREIDEPETAGHHVRYRFVNVCRGPMLRRLSSFTVSDSKMRLR